MSSIVAICSTAKLQPESWVSSRISKKNNFNLDCIGVSPVPGVPARSWTMVASHSHTCSSHISPCYISLIDHYSQPHNGPSLCKYNENVSDKVLSRTPHLPAPRGEPGEERMQFTASLRDLFDRNYKIIKCTSPSLISPSIVPQLHYSHLSWIQQNSERQWNIHIIIVLTKLFQNSVCFVINQSSTRQGGIRKLKPGRNWRFDC